MQTRPTATASGMLLTWMLINLAAAVLSVGRDLCADMRTQIYRVCIRLDTTRYETRGTLAPIDAVSYPD
jgi:hypothetical protein